jgi:hypothetical protein
MFIKGYRFWKVLQIYLQIAFINQIGLVVEYFNPGAIKNPAFIKYW